MTSWVDIATTEIEAGDLPRAEIAAALRGRDAAGATKMLGFSTQDATAGSTSATTETTLKTFDIYLPADIPSGYELHFPCRVSFDRGIGTPKGPTNGEIRLRVAGVDGPLRTVGVSSSLLVVLDCVADHARGTIAACELRGRVIPDGNTGTSTLLARIDERKDWPIASIRSG